MTGIDDNQMRDNPDIRWQQRYSNFSRAFKFLKNSLNIEEPSDTERAGIIQFYEVAFELAWKTLKDYLTNEGYLVKTPRDTIKTAFQNEFISDGHAWLEALISRNLAAHTYDEKMAKEMVYKIRNRYLPLLDDFNQWVTQRIK